MEPIKNILVGLDTTEMDETLIRFTTYIVDTSSAENVYFTNIVKNLDISDEVQKEFPQLKEHALNERQSILKNEVDEWFKPEREVNIKYHVNSGRATKSFLKFQKAENIDLIIVGRKITSPGQGNLVTRLARRADCQLLIIPENTLPSPLRSKILVPIDFSEHSKLALELAVNLGARAKETEIIAQNVYFVPAGYHYSGKSFKEFGEIMKTHAQKDFKNFIRDINTEDLKIKDVYSLDINDNLVSDIYDFAEEIKPNLIIIGAKGRTATAAMFIGSFAEKLINPAMKYPLLVVRQKGKQDGLLDYFREM